jgi:hypothetical protein
MRNTIVESKYMGTQYSRVYSKRNISFSIINIREITCHIYIYGLNDDENDFSDNKLCIKLNISGLYCNTSDNHTINPSL